MNYKLTLLIILFTANNIFAQTADTSKDNYNLGFEQVVKGSNLPQQWRNASPKGYKITTDSVEKHSGKRSLLIEKTDASQQDQAAPSIVIPAKYEGKTIELTAYMKFQNVQKNVNLMLRINDNDNQVLQFADLKNLKTKGTDDWKQYRIILPLPKDARTITIWPLLAGTGKLWVDDVQLLIDGKDISLAPIKADYSPNLPAGIPFGNNPAVGGTVKLKDADIYYEIYGKGEPLLLLHGNSQSIVDFRKQIKEFQLSHRVIAVDSRGQGKSTDRSTGALNYNLFAEDMKTLLDSLHIPKTSILGWSDGGNTGLIMASKYPELIHKVAVMGATIFPAEKTVSKQTLAEVNMGIQYLKTQNDPKSKMQLRLFNMLIEEPNMTVQEVMKIKAPVLVMAGEKDLILEEHTKYIVKLIPGSRLLIFKGATHYAPLEIPEQFNAEVLSFLNGH